MVQLIMMMTKYGRFVGKAPGKDAPLYAAGYETLKDAVHVQDVMTQNGPMISGNLIGDAHVKSEEIDVYVDVDMKGNYADVYYQAVNPGLITKPKKGLMDK